MPTNFRTQILFLLGAVLTSTLLAASGNQQDSLRLMLLLESAREEFNTQPEVSGMYAQAAYTLAGKLDFPEAMVDAQYQMGKVEELGGEYGKALLHTQAALATSRALQDSIRISKGLNNLAVIYLDLLDHDEALKALLEAAQINRIMGLKDGLSNNYNNIATLYYDQAQYEQSKYYHEKALQIRQEIGNPDLIADSQTNLGDVYTALGELDLAREYLLKAHQYFQEADQPYGLSFTYHNLGLLFTKEKNYEEALSYFNESLQLCQSLDPAGVALSLLNLSAVHLKMEDYDQAIAYAEQGLKEGQKMNSLLDIRDAYQLLDSAWMAKGDFRKAYRYSHELEAVNQKIKEEEKNRETLVWQMRFDVKEKENEIRLLTAQNDLKDLRLQTQRNTWGILFAGLILLALIIGVPLRLRALRKKAELGRRMVELEHRALQAQMNPYFIFNCLNSIQGLVMEQDQRGAIQYLSDFGQLLRSVLENASQKWVDLSSELSVLEHYLALEKMQHNDRFDYEITFQKGVQPEMLKVAPMIIQPYVENAIIHGVLPKKGKGKIQIDFAYKGQMLTCTVTDNGVGRKIPSQSSNQSERTSLGMNITEERLRLMEGPTGKGEVKIIDLFTPSREAAGTQIQIHLPHKVA